MEDGSGFWKRKSSIKMMADRFSLIKEFGMHGMNICYYGILCTFVAIDDSPKKPKALYPIIDYLISKSPKELFKCKCINACMSRFLLHFYALTLLLLNLL